MNIDIPRAKYQQSANLPEKAGLCYQYASGTVFQYLVKEAQENRAKDGFHRGEPKVKPLKNLLFHMNISNSTKYIDNRISI
ncbi:MAG: hypothetical protein ACTHKA_04610 [Anaerocolumna jejuensis]